MYCLRKQNIYENVHKLLITYNIVHLHEKKIKKLRLTRMYIFYV